MRARARVCVHVCVRASEYIYIFTHTMRANNLSKKKEKSIP